MEGWIKLHRDIQYNWVWQEKPFDKRSAWIDMIMMANHKENKVVLGNEIIMVERGSFITSEVKLMERWGWSKTKVRAFLLLLENDSMLVKKTDRKKTTLTICNYNVWQVQETTKEPQKNHEETTKEPQKDTNKKEKNEKNVKNKTLEDFFESVWSLYPKKIGKGHISTAKMKKLYEEVGKEEFTRCIERYKEHTKGQDMQYVQNGSTFFNNGYIDFLDSNYKQAVQTERSLRYAKMIK